MCISCELATDTEMSLVYLTSLLMWGVDRNYYMINKLFHIRYGQAAFNSFNNINAAIFLF